MKNWSRKRNDDISEHIDGDIYIMLHGKNEIRRIPLEKIYLRIMMLEEINAAAEEKQKLVKAGV